VVVVCTQRGQVIQRIAVPFNVVYIGSFLTAPLVGVPIKSGAPKTVSLEHRKAYLLPTGGLFVGKPATLAPPGTSFLAQKPHLPF
jgi:hypothetical protein